MRIAVILAFSSALLALSLLSCNQHETDTQANAPAANNTEQEGQPQAATPAGGREPVASDVREAGGAEVGEPGEPGAPEPGATETPVEPGEPALPGEGTDPPGWLDNNLAGAEVYRANNCVMCHGANREGTSLAPPLTGISQYWTLDNLKRYLTQPDFVIPTNQRLVDQKKKYNNLAMPPVEVSESDLTDLAKWLLAE